MPVNDLDEIRMLWRTISELQLKIEYTGTGHIRTTISTLLNHVREKERCLSDVDLTALALIHPDRWQRDWHTVL